jgi:hypothetical protein
VVLVLAVDVDVVKDENVSVMNMVSFDDGPVVVLVSNTTTWSV